MSSAWASVGVSALRGSLRLPRHIGSLPSSDTCPWRQDCRSRGKQARRCPSTDTENHSVRYLATLRDLQNRFAAIGPPPEHGQLPAYLNLPVHVAPRGASRRASVHRGAERTRWHGAILARDGGRVRYGQADAPLRGHRCWAASLTGSGDRAPHCRRRSVRALREHEGCY